LRESERNSITLCALRVCTPRMRFPSMPRPEILFNVRDKCTEVLQNPAPNLTEWSIFKNIVHDEHDLATAATQLGLIDS
jgi:hypothetical protein